ncbi:MAG TPA: universal stress protein [Acidimicrobiales bacterium]|jgi:nucleotide-binding universal stress UspA family protein
MFEHVVVGVTGSESGSAAVQRALKVAKASGSTLHLVSALEARRPGPPPMPEEFRFSIGSVDPVDWRLWQLRVQAEQADVEAVTHAVLADPVDALVHVADEEQADLIIVGAGVSHGRHRAKVSDELVRKTDCAVLVV